MKPQNKSLAYALAGNLYEHYCNSLFNFTLPFFGAIFFPDNKWILYYAVASGFIMQPFGAFIFSWVGDKFGRRPAVIYAFFLSIIPVFLIGVLPDYATGGIIASILLITCRVLQGASVGGAFYGTLTFVNEASKPYARNLNIGIVLSMGFVGVILGMACYRTVVLYLPASWGWRVPFLVGGIMGMGLYCVRGFLVESKAWESSVFEKRSRIPLLGAIKKYPKNIIAVLCAGMGGLVPFYLVAGWLPGILVKQYGLDQTEVLNTSIVMMVLGGCCTLFSCWVSSFWNLRKMLWICYLAFIPMGILLYIGLKTSNLYLIICGQILIAMNTGFSSSAFLLIQKLFPPRYAYSGLAVPYACGQALLTGTTPLLAGFIEKLSGRLENACGLMILATLLMGTMLYLAKPFDEENT